MTGPSPAQFAQAMTAFARVVGAANVATSEEDRAGYWDAFSPADDPAAGAPQGAVAPASVEEVQAVVRIANERRIPLWPISRGKNFGYGGAAPRIPGVVMLDLIRMDRIIEVNADHGYVILEPGVGFDQLFRHLVDNKIPLWMSAPAHTWGSVLGNALERGVGYTPYGEHASKICGMEIVLADGSLMRTGMGAMPGSRTGPLFPYGFGPQWDGAFAQSNYGIVTKMGLWLMPEPESTLELRMQLSRVEDLGPAVDALRPLKLAGVVQANPSFGNVIRGLATRATRSTYWQGTGPMPPEALEAARKQAGIGHWNFSVRLFGDEKINEINAAKVRAAFAAKVPDEFKESRWHKGEDLRGSGSPTPTLNALGVVDWLGGRGAHLTFSPVSAFTGVEAMKQYRTVRGLFESHGFDYYGGFTAGQRYLNHITMIVFDRDDDKQRASANALFDKLIDTAAANGWGEYRTHTLWYDKVAKSYSYNNNALLRFNERVKDAVDPNGIIAPGRMGIWPRAYRQGKGK